MTAGHSTVEWTGVVAILAGGQSRRFGRDKSKARIGGVTMLKCIRREAEGTGYPVIVVRRDQVAGMGPLGGVVTAFARRRAEMILFLACDMPFVSAGWMVDLMGEARRLGEAVFTRASGCVGFPFVLWRRELGVVHRQLEVGKRSLQEVARCLGAKTRRVRSGQEREFLNINTWEAWKKESARLVRAMGAD